MSRKPYRTRSRELFGSTQPFLVIEYAYNGEKAKYGTLLPTYYEQITDRVGPNPNEVSHVKRVYDRSSWSLPMARNSHNAVCTYGTSFTYGEGYRSKKTVYEATADFSGPMKQILNDAQGNLSQSVNLIVNVAEAAQLKTIVPQIIKVGKKLIKSGKGWMSLADMANMHLLYSFGVAPLVKDVRSAFNLNRQIVNRRDMLRKRNLKPTKLLARGFSSLDEHWTEPDIVSSGDWTASVKASGTATVKTCVSAICTAFYNVDNPSTNWKLVSQALGLTSPLSTTWELIPFSFVLDWFIPVGDALKECERRGLNLVDEAAVTRSYFLHDWCISEKHESTIRPYGTITASSWIPSYLGKRIGMDPVKYTRYTRRLGVIPSIDFLDPGGTWNLGRTALGLSLSIQRLNQTTKPGPKKWPSLSMIYAKAAHTR